MSENSSQNGYLLETLNMSGHELENVYAIQQNIQRLGNPIKIISDSFVSDCDYDDSDSKTNWRILTDEKLMHEDVDFSSENLRVHRFLDYVFCDFIEEFSNSSKTIVFVSLTPYFVQLKLANIFKLHGYQVGLLSINPIHPKVSGVFEDEFDFVINSGGSYSLFCMLLDKIDPQYFFIQCWMWQYFIARMVIESNNNSKTICEFYDITSVYASTDELKKVFSEQEVEFDIYSENYILRNADIVLTRFPDFVNQYWAKAHLVNRDIISFQAYTVSKYSETRPSYNIKTPKRLVYAGGLVPPSLPRELFPEATMFRVFERLLDQGFEIDVLHDPHRDLYATDDWGDYIALSEKYPGFNLLEGVNPDVLPKILQSYDFGILIADFADVSPVISWHQRSGVFATKLNFYVEAGLPIIVNSEYTAMAKFAELNEIGISISASEIDSLDEIIESIDYSKFKESIQHYRVKNSMAVKVLPLIDLMEEMSEQ